MSNAEDDEFGDIDVEDLLTVATTAEFSPIKRRPSPPAFRGRKRRRTDKSHSEGADQHSSLGSDSKGSRANSPQRKPRQAESVTEHNGLDDDDGTLRTPASSASSLVDQNEIDTLQEKPKSKYKIHIPKQTDTLPDLFYTQLPPSSQSPYRIRGPIWQKPKPASPAKQVDIVVPCYDEGISPVAFSDDEDVQRQCLDALNEFEKPTRNDSPLPTRAEGISKEPIELSSQNQNNQQWQSQQVVRPWGLAGPKTNLRQTTLFGGPAGDNASQPQPQSTRRHNFPLTNRQELPTHHTLNRDALGIWVYPTNLGTIRDYQYNIVAQGLFNNLLVALPTGLGKTFIAATIMLNWFRWTKDAQIVFVAPTKPLVSQQVQACFNIVGIPRSVTTMLTGNTSPGVRAEEWLNKRVFFMTPQTIVNDLKTGICDPKRLVLLVVDEAHRATGGYAYVEVVKFLRRFNTSFRVLALTATPGSSVEGVQEVIDGLGVARVAIRTEESLDIRQYVHQRKIDTVLFEYSEEVVMIMDLFSKVLQPVVNKLVTMNAYWGKDPMTLTPYGCTQARQKWMASDTGRKANLGVKGMVNTIFSLLASLAHSIELLKFHGIGPFFRKVLDFQSETEKNGEKGSKYRRQVTDNPDFHKMMRRIQTWFSDNNFIGHPKLDHLRNVALNHFLDAGDGRGTAAGESPARTRIMIFVHFRDSAEEVARVLKRHEPMIRPHVFVGQANSKGSEGMDQKKQLDIIEKFRSGVFNTLVATSIGEEGLDIGEVDLIICYDASASPIRMLQRMGRTGRKRAGNIVVLLMKGKEENSFMQAKDNYEKMQAMIAQGDRFNFRHDLSPRIVPMDIQPVVEKKMIDIPPENTQADLPEPKKRSKVPKRPPKKFYMPDNVHTGFTKASRLDNDEVSEDNDDSRLEEEIRVCSPVPEPVPSLDSVSLTATEHRALEREYQDVRGEGPQIVQVPSMDAFPAIQRKLRQIKYVKHGRTTKAVIGMLGIMHRMTVAVHEFGNALQPEDRISIDAQAEKRMAYVNRTSARQKASRVNNARQPFLPSNTSCGSPAPTRVDVSLIDGGTEQEEEEDDGLGDFIDDEVNTGGEVPSSASSPPDGQPFYEAPKTIYSVEEDSDGDLPDFSTLIQKQYHRVASESPTKSSRLIQSQRKVRRMVVDSESDDG